MSRLDSFFARVEAQRIGLNWLADRLNGRNEPILELGLGNGRTYSHLREIFPEAPIHVFDREIAAHPDSIPGPAFTILGDFRDSLPTALDRIGRPAMLIHGDFGSANREKTDRLARFLDGALEGLVAPGGYVFTDQRLEVAGLERLPLPSGLREGVYHLLRRPD